MDADLDRPPLVLVAENDPEIREVLLWLLLDAGYASGGAGRTGRE
jgi:hypothetical protein